DGRDLIDWKHLNCMSFDHRLALIFAWLSRDILDSAVAFGPRPPAQRFYFRRATHRLLRAWLRVYLPRALDAALFFVRARVLSPKRALRAGTSCPHHGEFTTSWRCLHPRMQVFRRRHRA